VKVSEIPVPRSY